MADLVERLRAGNLDVTGEARHINALLALHREAADEIERLRACVAVCHETLGEIENRAWATRGATKL